MLTIGRNLYLVALLLLSFLVLPEKFVASETLSMYITVGLCYLWLILEFLRKHNKSELTLGLSELLVSLFILYAVVYGRYMGSLNFEWVISGFSLLLFYAIVKRIQWNLLWIFASFVAIGVLQTLYGLGQYLNWFNSLSWYPMSGSFDNPAGFAAALSVVFPFTLYFISKKNIYSRLFGGIAAALIITAVALSKSRAGVMAIVVICGIWMVAAINIGWFKQWSRKARFLVLGVVASAILVGLYFIKKDSADGRLLIWQCTAKMISEKPIMGYGAGGFQREYMLYQADFFKDSPNSKYAMFSDIVKHPFNEFLLLLVEHGIIGALFFIVFALLLIQEYRKKNSQEKRYIGLCIAGILTFGCFSYLLNYPFVRLIALFSVALIMKDEKGLLDIPKQVLVYLRPLMILFFVSLLGVCGKMLYDEYKWCAIAHRSLAGETRKVLPEYAKLHRTMSRNSFFLYNYGAELNFIGEAQRSNILLKECTRFYNDNDVQLLLAENFIIQKKYNNAEQCLLLAYYMIPNRFIPLYRLVKLYEMTGRHNDACRIAKVIMKKPVKIPSSDVMIIKAEMRDFH